MRDQTLGLFVGADKNAFPPFFLIDNVDVALVQKNAFLNPMNSTKSCQEDCDHPHKISLVAQLPRTIGANPPKLPRFAEGF